MIVIFFMSLILKRYHLDLFSSEMDYTAQELSSGGV
jgi:hypothetical protein